MDDYAHEDERGWCTECGEECYVIEIDNGIGPYEFWGARGVHRDYAYVSNCCEADVTDVNLNEEDEE